MKKINLKKTWKQLVTAVAVVGQVAVSAFIPITAYASIVFPQQVTMEYDNNSLYTMTGSFADGTPYSWKDAPLFAVYDGVRQPVFCIEPTVMIDNAITSGYTSNPLPDMANKPKAKYLSVLWKYAGTDADTQIVAQAMIWQEVNGLTITSITRPDGTTLTNYQAIKDKINQIVSDYEKKPSFSGQTIKVVLGESVTLVDSDNVGLSRFDTLSPKSDAKVDWNVDGNKLVVTPNKDSNTNGMLRFYKSVDEGTPVAYKLAGQQTVMAGAIDDPNWYQINLEVIKTGEVKIVKLDKGTGDVVPNTEFKVEYDGKSQTVKTNDKGEAIVKDILHDTKVKVTETFVPAPYILDTNNTKEVVIQANKTASVEFKNEHATGKSTLTKVDETTESNEPVNPAYPMSGAKYGWFKEDGTLIKEFTLDDSLSAMIDKQELGNYFWKETVAPVGYTLDQTKHVVELTYKDQYTPVVVKDADSQDDVIRMNLDGQKLIQNETNEMFKNNVEFTLTNKRTGETHVVKTATTDGKKGYFNFADIALDDYVLTETKGVEGYKNVDPIEITHSYNKETASFTFTVKDQKSGNILNEETFTQLELSSGENVDLGTYTLKDKAEIVETPEVGISTKAHTGDGETNTFVWGEEAKFYDDSILTHKNIEIGTKRAKEVKLYAVYTDKEGKKTTEVVWSSGLVDYEVSDKEMTERVIADYDYRKDKKADENTRWYFGEDGYNYDEEKPKKDTEHNPDGKDPKQDITPIVKETPNEETPKETQKATESLPYTGEQVGTMFSLVGIALLSGVGCGIYLLRKKKQKSETKPE